MNNFFIYLLQVSAGTALLYLIYWIFLRKETFFFANRFFLIFSLIAAVVLPLFPVYYPVISDASNSLISENLLSNTGISVSGISPETDPDPKFNLIQIMWIIYFSGVSLFASRIFFQTLSLVKIIFRKKFKKTDGFLIVENERYTMPFSFINIIFIHPEIHHPEELSQIIAHEKVHIRERHWFDLIIVELLTVIFWFNPFIWLFERSVKQNHEFLADVGVLSRGHAVGRYQAMLVNQMLGARVIGLANNLNYALYPNRLKMMTKMKTKKIKLTKFLIALPALAFLLFAFARPEIKTENETLQNSASLNQNNKDEQVITGKVSREENGNPVPGVSVILKGTTHGTITNGEGKFKLTDLTDEFIDKFNEKDIEIVFSYVGLKSQVIKVGSNGKITAENVEIKMKDDVIGIYIGNLPPPPPPPPSSTKKQINKQQSPPPPPPPPISVTKKGEDGKPEELVFFVVEEMPEFPGGYNALEEYFQQEKGKILKDKSLNNTNISGKKVKAGFTVENTGNVADVNIVESTDDFLSKKVLEILNNMPDWKPGKQRGKPVPVKYVMTLDF